MTTVNSEITRLGSLSKFCKTYFGSNLTFLMPTLPIVMYIGAHRKSGKGYRGQLLEHPEYLEGITKHLMGTTGATFASIRYAKICLVLHRPLWDKPVYLDGCPNRINQALTSFVVSSLNGKYKLDIPYTVIQSTAFNMPSKEDVLYEIVDKERKHQNSKMDDLLRKHGVPGEMVLGASYQERRKYVENLGISWYGLPSNYRNGTYFKRAVVQPPFTEEVLNHLPENHRARRFPDWGEPIHYIKQLDLPDLADIQNLGDVIFNPQLVEPVTK